jgi:hypothetical protein
MDASRVCLLTNVSGVAVKIQGVAVPAITQTLTTLTGSPRFLESSLHNSARSGVPNARNVYPNGGLF